MRFRWIVTGRKCFESCIDKVWTAALAATTAAIKQHFPLCLDFTYITIYVPCIGLACVTDRSENEEFNLRPLWTTIQNNKSNGIQQQQCTNIHTNTHTTKTTDPRTTNPTTTDQRITNSTTADPIRMNPSTSDSTTMDTITTDPTKTNIQRIIFWHVIVVTVFCDAWEKFLLKV